MIELFILFQARPNRSWRATGIEVIGDAVPTLYAILIVLAVIYIIFVLCTTKKADWVSFFTNKKVNFLDYKNANQYLELVENAFADGNEGAFFLPIAKHPEVAEKIAVDLFFSGNEDYKRYAASLLGFIEDPVRHLFVRFYRAEKQYYDSLPEDDFKRYNSQAVVEELIMSTLTRIELAYSNGTSTSTARFGRDWVNFLYEVVNDAIDGYEWNTFEEALILLMDSCPHEKRVELLYDKYKEFVSRTKRNRDLFDTLEDISELIMKKVNIAKSYELNRQEKNLIGDIITFTIKQGIVTDHYSAKYKNRNTRK